MVEAPRKLRKKTMFKHLQIYIFGQSYSSVDNTFLRSFCSILFSRKNHARGEVSVNVTGDKGYHILLQHSAFVIKPHVIQDRTNSLNVR